jgi:hypothetical protein
MVNYQDAKIYKLVGYGKTYYGSTTQALNQRKGGHKRKLNCMSKEIFKLGDDVDIVLVESYPCNNKEELHQRERYYIENNECINKKIPLRTINEWRKENKDKIKDDGKKYYEDNKDKIKDYQKEYYNNNLDLVKGKLKEYREKTKDKRKDYDNEYRKKNIEKIKLRNNEKKECECGEYYTRANKARHLKTSKHKKYIENINKNI